MIQNGELGEIKRINWIITSWYRSQSYYDSGDWRATWRGEGGGVLFNQCPHQLDLLQWVTGMMPARVHTFCHFGKWHDIEVEDDVTAYLEYDNGATGVFVTSTADAPGTNRFEILGNNGKLVCEADPEKGDKLTFYKLETPEREFNATHTGGFGEPKHEVIDVETDGKNPQHVGIMNNFANAILGLEPLFVDGTEGINGVELMDSMLLSTWLGKTVDLPIDDDQYLDELKKRIATGRRKEGVDVVLDTEGTYK
jgi:predicted dehydrogenase